MTDAEKIVLVKAMSDETDDVVISAFLSMAEDEAYEAVDPFHTCEKADIIAECSDYALIKLAAYHISKIGWDFQTSHSENGVSRVYESGDIPDSILRMLPPRRAASLVKKDGA